MNTKVWVQFPCLIKVAIVPPAVQIVVKLAVVVNFIVQMGLGWVGLLGVVLERLSLNQSLNHCLTHWEIGSHSMVLALAVPVTFLSLEIKTLQITHHGKFRSVGGLHPKPGIPWIPIHNWQRSFLSSLAEVWISYSLKCLHMLANQRPVSVRCWVLLPQRVQLPALFIGLTLYAWILTFTECTQKPSVSPVWCHMASDPLMMVCGTFLLVHSVVVGQALTSSRNWEGSGSSR